MDVKILGSHFERLPGCVIPGPENGFNVPCDALQLAHETPGRAG